MAYKPRCRCEATLNAAGECPYRCPPKTKKVAPRIKPEPERERGFRWTDVRSGVESGNWKDVRDRHYARRNGVALALVLAFAGRVR